jgi:hypothetical protein
MLSTGHTRLNTVAVIGLALGAVFGMAGTIVTQPTLQNTLWGIDSVGLIMATALMTLKFFRKGVFAIGESVNFRGPQRVWSEVSLHSLQALPYGLLPFCSLAFLKSSQSGVRLLGITTSILFAITAARSFWGEQLLPTSSPLPFFGYPFLVATFVAWIWTLLKEKPKSA